MPYLTHHFDFDYTVKPYCQFKSVENNSFIAVSLVDTQGNPIKCNWCSVVLVDGGNEDSLWWVQIPDLAGVPDLTPSTIIGLTGQPLPCVGFGGSERPLSNTKVNIFVAEKDVFSTIEIKQITGGTKNFCINYGYRRPVNHTRASSRQDGS